MITAASARLRPLGGKARPTFAAAPAGRPLDKHSYNTSW